MKESISILFAYTETTETRNEYLVKESFLTV